MLSVALRVESIRCDVVGRMVDLRRMWRMGDDAILMHDCSGERACGVRFGGTGCPIRAREPRTGSCGMSHVS